ncbi:MAG: hypothetical protein JSV00_07490 [bacterium]|nr:MAG: hypothetical protein JSV00_07490 [bacterium]
MKASWKARRAWRLLILFLAIALLLPGCFGNRARRTRTDPLASVRDVAARIRALAEEPLPVALEPAQAAYFEEFRGLLLQLGASLEGVVAEAQGTPGYDYRARIREIYSQFNLQVGQLRERMGGSAAPAELSQVVKSRHESAARILNNIL